MKQKSKQGIKNKRPNPAYGNDSPKTNTKISIQRLIESRSLFQAAAAMTDMLLPVEERKCFATVLEYVKANQRLFFEEVLALPINDPFWLQLKQAMEIKLMQVRDERERERNARQETTY